MPGIYRLGDLAPRLAASAWVAPGARLIGDVALAEEASIWFGAVLRGDNEPIEVGAGSNVQDNAVLHTDPGFPLVIGEGCTIGHGAVVHGCRIGGGSLIGMGATVMNGAEVGARCLVGANALITEGASFAPGTLILGSPAKAVRALSDEAMEGLAAAALVYRRRAVRYRADLKRV